VHPPEISDQLKTVATAQCEPAEDQLRLLSNEHRPRARRSIGLAADQQPLGGVNQTGKPKADQRSRVSDEYLRSYQGCYRGFQTRNRLRPRFRPTDAMYGLSIAGRRLWRRCRSLIV